MKSHVDFFVDIIFILMDSPGPFAVPACICDCECRVYAWHLAWYSSQKGMMDVLCVSSFFSSLQCTHFCWLSLSSMGFYLW